MPPAVIVSVARLREGALQPLGAPSHQATNEFEYPVQAICLRNVPAVDEHPPHVATIPRFFGPVQFPFGRCGRLFPDRAVLGYSSRLRLRIS